MNVYSIVPSQRSQATVSTMISKTIPRYAQMTAPISSIGRELVDVDLPAGGLDALGDEDDRERVRGRPDEERELPPRVALDQVPVALEDAAEPDELVTERLCCSTHQAHTSLSSSLPRSSSERRAGRGEERLLERLGAVAPLQLVDGLEAEQLAPVEDPDAVGERLGLGHVVRAEQDRRVVRGPHLADELLHLELRARVEPGRRLVEQQQHGRGRAAPGRARPSAACRATGSPSARRAASAGSRPARGCAGSCRLVSRGVMP